MAGTFSQIQLQVVFGVKHRQPLLIKPWRYELFKYMAGVIQKKGQKCLIVNGVEDHVHLFIGLRPNQCISDLVRDIKSNASRFINENGYLSRPFEWQEGYGVFSYARSETSAVYNYILNQEEHHNTVSFEDEYIQMLKDADIPYNERYLFDNAA